MEEMNRCKPLARSAMVVASYAVLLMCVGDGYLLLESRNRWRSRNESVTFDSESIPVALLLLLLLLVTGCTALHCEAKTQETQKRSKSPN